MVGFRKKKEFTLKRVFLAIGTLALVALLGVTMVDRTVGAQDTATPGASTAPATDTTGKESNREAYLAALAEKLGVTTEQLQTAIDETNQELGTGGMMNGRGDSNGGQRGEHGNRGNADHAEGKGRVGGMLRGIDRAEAASFLGVTEEELTTELQSGKTFLEISSEHGKTTDDVRAFLIQQATAAIDAALQQIETAPTAEATPTA